MKNKNITLEYYINNIITPSMNNKKIITKASPSLKNSQLTSEFKPQSFNFSRGESQKYLLELSSKSFNNKHETKEVGLNNREYTSPTSVWKNSIYSFNQNYMKNIPSVDNIVNKMIKSFFSINALDNNPEGKKSRLIQRRYKRLSLNKIFVSKSEIKHSNNKVIVTVYLFNKKRNTLLLNLNKLYNSLSLGLSNLSYKNISWRKKNNFEKLALKSFGSTTIESHSLPIGKNNFSNLSLKESSENNIIKLNTNKTNLSTDVYNTDKRATILKKIFTNNYAFMPIVNKLNNNKSNHLSKSLGSNKNVESKLENLEFNNKIFYYNRLNNLTKYNIYKFINSLSLNSSLNLNPKLLTTVYKIFVYTNQYKLYNNKIENLNSGNIILSDIFNNKATVKSNVSLSLKNINYSIYKLKSLYKLFALYNNFNINVNPTSESSFAKIYTNKLLLNTYKLLKKSNTQISRENTLSIKKSLMTGTKISKSKNTNGSLINRKGKTLYLSDGYKRKQKNTIILMNKLNRIDRFFKKYENVFFKKLPFNKETNSIKGLPLGSTYKISSQVISNYKINFINDLLEKELLYVYYLKLLSYNNAVFKSWFLFPLKNLIAKIYNKKVIFNLINLRYIHLNSDILSQAVDIRLRNFRKNKLVEVLRRAVKLVSVSKVNIYACDEHSSMYKYIHNYYNKYRHLKLDIFKELENLEESKTLRKINSALKADSTKNDGTFTPCVIRRLTHIQTSTINFIKFKSVFGVRLEAAGRLTKRSTASRALFKFRYKGTLKNNSTINNLSATIIKNHQISNLQLTKISSKTRNGSFGLKGWINSN